MQSIFICVYIQIQINEDNAMKILEILIFNLADVTNGDCTDSGTSSYDYELLNANMLFEFILE